MQPRLAKMLNKSRDNSQFSSNKTDKNKHKDTLEIYWIVFGTLQHQVIRKKWVF